MALPLWPYKVLWDSFGCNLASYILAFIAQIDHWLAGRALQDSVSFTVPTGVRSLSNLPAAAHQCYLLGLYVRHWDAVHCRKWKSKTIPMWFSTRHFQQIFTRYSRYERRRLMCPEVSCFWSDRTTTQSITDLTWLSLNSSQDLLSREEGRKSNCGVSSDLFKNTFSVFQSILRSQNNLKRSHSWVGVSF